MTTRRDFVKNSIVSIGGLSMGPKLLSNPSELKMTDLQKESSAQKLLIVL